MVKRIKEALALWQEEKKNRSSSLQGRLILFFVFITTFIILAFWILLLLFGVTGSAKSTVFDYISNEMYHINTKISNDFGQLSVAGVSFAQSLAKDSELFLAKQNLTVDDLQSNPELIEPLLSNQTKSMMAFIQHSSCSGIFTILDTTINPEIENSKYSRSGVFLKITQPNKISSVSSKFRLLRGPASIARENDIELLGQWKMEFNTENQEFFEKVMNTAKDNPNLPLSRLYYWTERILLKDNSEAGFLLCVPLISSDKTVFGICGIEVSDRMFKIDYSPNNVNYANIFSALTPLNDLTLHSEKGLIAGNYYLTGSQLNHPLTIYDEKTGFATYLNKENSLKFGGLHTPVKLYPNNSPYGEENWVLSVMMPMNSLLKIMQGNRNKLLIIMSILLLLSFGISIFISKRYLRPVTEALDTIKSKNYKKKSNYLEINDLMEYLAKQDEDEKNKDSKSKQDFTPMFEEFLENIKKLTPAEKNVFDMYLQGYNAQEIAGRLFLSINTIKTHNKKIFSKLNISTRKELLVYIDMMKKLNMI